MFKRNYRKLILTVLAALLLITVVACEKDEEGMVAIVDGDGISNDELEKKFNLVGIRENTELQFGEGALEQEIEDGVTLERKLKEELLEQLVVVKIIANNANKDIEITEEMLKEQKLEYIENVGGQENFTEFLEERGLTEEELEDYMIEDLLVKEHQKNLMDKMEVSEEEAREYFEENKDDIIIIRLEHILLKEKAEAESVLKRINEGEDFAKLAKSESIHTNSAENGGDIGYITRNSPLIEEYKDIGFELDINEISDVVESELGYSIIRLVDRKEDFEFFEEDIITNIKMESLSKKIEEMKEKADYKLMPENIVIGDKEVELEKEKE